MRVARQSVISLLTLSNDRYSHNALLTYSQYLQPLNLVMESRECDDRGANVLFIFGTQCLREAIKGLEVELKQNNERFEVTPVGKDRNMVDGQIKLITAHI